MKKIIVFTAAGLGLAMFLTAGNVSAQVVTGTATVNSSEFGYDPANLIAAVNNTDASAGPCFTCRNTNVGGTTAGALTNSMFGVIRTNAEADLGDKSYDPATQGMTIPSAKGCSAAGCNDAGAFTFSLPLPTLDFLSEGAVVANTNPSISETVGQSGVKMEFSNTFEYLGDGNGSRFSQTMKQTTFTDGGDFTTDGSGIPGIQVVDFSASGVAGHNNTGVGASSQVDWTQTIEEGGFSLGPLSGSFNYIPGDGNVPGASAPTGPGQSGDPADSQQIGG